MVISPVYEGETAIICGTGPSITKSIIKRCNSMRAMGSVRLFGANLTYREFNLNVLHACNYQFYDHYYPIDSRISDGLFDKWTTRPELNGKYKGVNYIEEVWADGFSVDPSKIHAHHGTSPQLMNIALHYGITKMLLVGFDMRYPDKVTDKDYRSPRHYFGEYANNLQHWPRTGAQGELEGLIKEMETIKPEDYGIEIINCTPDSAMTCFPMGNLEDYV